MASIGINLLYMLPGVVGGTETYAAGLLHGLSQLHEDDEYFIFVNRESKDWQLPPSEKFTKIVCPVDAVRRGQRYFFEQIRFPKLVRRYSVDLLHSLGYVSPLRLHCPSVLTVPDLNFLAFGNQMPIYWSTVLGFFVKSAAKRAVQIITISEYSRSLIIEKLGIEPNNVTVTHLAPKVGSISPRQTSEVEKMVLPERYMVVFSSKTPNKNIPAALRALSLARDKYKMRHSLVLIGHRPSGGELEKIVQELGVGDVVKFTGYITDREKKRILERSDFLFFPSLYEGFGLPILEAMELGVSVVSSDRAALPEIGGSAAVYCDPSSIEDMARAISGVALNQELQSTLRKKGLINMERFSWRNTAEKTLEVYRRVLEG